MLLHSEKHANTFQILIIGAQSCVDTAVNVQQQGTNRLSSNLYVIVPRSNFSCNGRITGYLASLDQDDDEDCSYPRIVLWRPLNTEKTMYSYINRYTVRRNDIDRVGSYYFANTSFNGNDRIEFQSGDVIGYQHRSSPCYRVWSISTTGYISYSTSSTSSTIDINSVTATSSRQPLIQVLFGMAHLVIVLL